MSGYPVRFSDQEHAEAELGDVGIAFGILDELGHDVSVISSEWLLIDLPDKHTPEALDALCTELQGVLLDKLGDSQVVAEPDGEDALKIHIRS